MASRKQRKRREKEKRHEYELVLVDETGEERPIDPSELRSEKRSTSAAKTTGKSPGGKSAPAKGSTKGRPIREVKPPSWNRVGKRAAFFAVFMFVVLNFVGGKHKTIVDTLVPTVLYTVLFVPFLYLLDRLQYNQYLKRSGQLATASPARGSTTDEAQETGPRASLRRALRR